LSGALRVVHAAHRSGERSASKLEEVARTHLAAAGIEEVDYVAIADPNTLEPLVHTEDGAIVAVAARVGRTRLIDNVILGAP
jgi:pantoate--beta-alanine ligase